MSACLLLAELSSSDQSPAWLLGLGSLLPIKEWEAVPRASGAVSCADQKTAEYGLFRPNSSSAALAWCLPCFDHWVTSRTRVKKPDTFES